MPQTVESGVTPLAIIQKINELFSDAVIATDVGRNQLWATQFLELTDRKKMLTSGGLGTMGHGLPAALGAGPGNPDKEVIAIWGMSGSGRKCFPIVPSGKPISEMIMGGSAAAGFGCTRNDIVCAENFNFGY